MHLSNEAGGEIDVSLASFDDAPFSPSPLSGLEMPSIVGAYL